MNKTIVVLILLITLLNCKSQEARKPISTKTGTFIKESVARNKALLKKETNYIKTIIDNDTLQYISSKNGFWYTKIDSNNTTNITPKFGDIIEFNYNISSLNDSIIYNQKNMSYAMDQEELFTGLREGLKLMKAGETYQFIFPSQKAYGYYGDENKIGTNVPIKSTVSVKSITKK